MAHAVMKTWVELVESGRFDQVADLLAADSVFYSPALFTPAEGRDQVVAYLSAAAKVFADNDFRYVEQWHSEHSAILEFTATIDGIHVNGIDMLHWNDAGRITEVKVMLRPLKALQTVIPKMAELLARS